MVFPEGTRSAEGKLARFRPGIGLLAKQSFVPVLARGHPRAGRAEDRASEAGSGPGILEVRIGEAIRFAPEETEAAITARLHDEVERLMGNAGSKGAS